MMAIKVTSNIDKELRQMRKSARRAGDFRAPHKKISIMLDRWVQRNFKTQGGNVGGWKPFMQVCMGGRGSRYGFTKTCASGRLVGKGRTRKIDRSAKLLQDTGALRASYRPFHSAKDAGIGSDLKLIEYHKILEKAYGLLKSHPELSGFTVTQSAIINENPNLAPWIGVYPDTIAHEPGRLGSVLNWGAEPQFRVVVQRVAGRTGAKLEQKMSESIGSAVKAILAPMDEWRSAGLLDGFSAFTIEPGFREVEGGVLFRESIITFTGQVEQTVT